jgi:hypothetical protein
MELPVTGSQCKRKIVKLQYDYPLDYLPCMYAVCLSGKGPAPANGRTV